MLENHWSWFTDTMLSRLEEHGKIIIIMTRWASGDLAGRATKHFKETGIIPASYYESHAGGRLYAL